jgi:hypothetical protein
MKIRTMSETHFIAPSIAKVSYNVNIKLNV